MTTRLHGNMSYIFEIEILLNDTTFLNDKSAIRNDARAQAGYLTDPRTQPNKTYFAVSCYTSRDSSRIKKIIEKS